MTTHEQTLPEPKQTRGARLDTCHRCGHVHEGFKECGVEMGVGRICRCEMEVAA